MKRQGFTLIELLVVIAIIGTLSSIVLTSVNTARSKGNDAAIKSDLDNMRAQAAIYYDSHNNTYSRGSTNICDPSIFSFLNSRSWIPLQVRGLIAAAPPPDFAPNNFLIGVAQYAGVGSVSVGHAGGPGIVTCNASATAWVAEAPLPGNGGFYCVDSTGFSGVSASSKVTSGTDYDCQ